MRTGPGRGPGSEAVGGPCSYRARSIGYLTSRPSRSGQPSGVGSAACRRSGNGGLPQVQVAIEVNRGVDEGQVREGLREVAKLLARAPYLLGEQAEVIAVGEHLLEHQARLVEAPGAGQRVNIPAGAQREGALRSAQAD